MRQAGESAGYVPQHRVSRHLQCICEPGRNQPHRVSFFTFLCPRIRTVERETWPLRPRARCGCCVDYQGLPRRRSPRSAHVPSVMGRRGRRRRRTAGAAARSPDILHADTALAAVTEQLEGMKVHADTALAAVTEQLEGMKVADERRVEVLTRRQEWREELTAQQVVVSLATRRQAAARGLLTRAALAHQHP